MIRTSTDIGAVTSVVAGYTEHLTGGNIFQYTFPDPKTLINQILSYIDFDDKRKFYIWTTPKYKQELTKITNNINKPDDIQTFYQTFCGGVYICDKVPLHCTSDDYLMIVNIDQEYAELFIDRMKIKDFTIYINAVI